MSGSRDDKTRTHNAFALKRETRVSGRWLDIGNARLELDLSRLPEHLVPYVPQLLQAVRVRGNVFLDRTPIGGFNGQVFLSPIGEKPTDPMPQPQRPDQPAAPDDEEI
jgi:hypothetical protein